MTGDVEVVIRRVGEVGSVVELGVEALYTTYGKLYTLHYTLYDFI